MPKSQEYEISLLDNMFHMTEHFINVQITTLLEVQITWVSVCILCYLNQYYISMILYINEHSVHVVTHST